MTNDSIASNDVLENLTTAILVLDTSFRVCYINTATEILFEISQRQAEHIPLQTLLPGEKRLFDTMRRVMKTGQAVIEREV